MADGPSFKDRLFKVWGFAAVFIGLVILAFVGELLSRVF